MTPAMPKKDGQLLIWSVPTKPIYSRSELKDAAEKHSLDLSILPRVTSGPDKFAKACTEVVGRPEWRNVTDSLSRKVILRWTKVQNTKDLMQQDLMQQIVHGSFDAAGNPENPVEHSVFKVFYHKNLEPPGNLTFQVPSARRKQGDGSFATVPITDQVWAPGVDYSDFIRQVIEQQSVYENHMDAPQVVEMLKRYIKRLGGFQYRKARGVYFIPEHKIEECDRFVQAIREFSDGQVDISTVPLYSDKQMKAEMSEFFENSMSEELERIIEDIDESGAMQDRKIARLESEVAHMKDVFKAYKGKMPKERVGALISRAEGSLTLAKSQNQILKDKKEADKLRAKEAARQNPTMKGKVVS